MTETVLFCICGVVLISALLAGLPWVAAGAAVAAVAVFMGLGI